MKLLFDENLSPRLASLLADEFPECEHLRDAGLMSARDELLWEFARANDYSEVCNLYVQTLPPATD